MAQKGSRARSQSAGRGWNDSLMDAVAVQIANSFQFGAKGRRGEAHLGKGRGPKGSSQQDNPQDWMCNDCGASIWARKTECPFCNPRQSPKPREVKEQGETPGSQEPPTQQQVGTEGEAAKLEDAKKRQLKHLGKTLAGWPEEGKDSDSYRSLQKDAEDLKNSLTSSQPTDIQILGAKEEVNTARRRVLKSEKKRDQAIKDLTTARDEVAAARAVSTATVERLEKLETAKKAVEHPQEEPVVTSDEQEMLKQLRAIKSGQSGPVGSETYRSAMANLLAGGTGMKQEEGRGRGPSAPSTPTGRAASATPTRTAPPRSVLDGSPSQGTPLGALQFGPATEGKKRSAEEGSDEFQRSQEATRSGAAMDTEGATAAPVPGPMSQDLPGAAAMEVDGGIPPGNSLTPEEQAQWDKSEIARAKELALEEEEKLAGSAQERGKGSPGKGRPTKEEQAARRASRSPYKKKEEEESTASLEVVQEEAGGKKVPSDAGEDDDEEAGEEPPEPAEGSPQEKQD
jgi:hypothetical protein